MNRDGIVDFNQSIVNAGYREYMVRTDDESEALPITNASLDYRIDGMNPGNERTYLEVAFFSDEEMTTKVTPTGGTVTMVGYMTKFMVERTIDMGQFDVTTWQDPTKNIPAASAPMRGLRVNFDGVTGNGVAYAAVTILKGGF